MENGELKMENTAVYDLSGRKVANGSSSLGTLRKGVYIVGGKKVVF